MKRVRPSGYHHNEFLATHLLKHMIYGYHVPKSMSCHKAVVLETGKEAACCVFMMTYLHIYLSISISIYLSIYLFIYLLSDYF